MQKNLAKKIWAKRESGLTAVRLKRDPPVYRQSKLKALVMNIAMQRIRAVEVADMIDLLCTCKTQWCMMGMLIIIT